jgi:hypothetical protein
VAPHQCCGADDEGGSGELSSGSADIRGGPGHGLDGKGAQSSGQLWLPRWSISGLGALDGRLMWRGGSCTGTLVRRAGSLELDGNS